MKTSSSSTGRGSAVFPPKAGGRLPVHGCALKARSIVVATLVVAYMLLNAGLARADEFAVNSTADTVDVNVGNGQCATSTGACTLRAAIQEANIRHGADTITVPGGLYTIRGSGVVVDPPDPPELPGGGFVFDPAAVRRLRGRLRHRRPADDHGRRRRRDGARRRRAAARLADRADGGRPAVRDPPERGQRHDRRTSPSARATPYEGGGDPQPLHRRRPARRHGGARQRVGGLRRRALQRRARGRHLSRRAARSATAGSRSSARRSAATAPAARAAPSSTPRARCSSAAARRPSRRSPPTTPPTAPASTTAARRPRPARGPASTSRTPGSRTASRSPTAARIYNEHEGDLAVADVVVHGQPRLGRGRRGRQRLEDERLDHALDVHRQPLRRQRRRGQHARASGRSRSPTRRSPTTTPAST